MRTTPLLVFIALGVFPVPAIAQVGPLAPGSLAVTPDGSTTATRQANTGAYDEMFIVKNNYTTSLTVTITCFGRVNVTCTGADITQIVLAPGAQIDVDASYTVGSAGTGRLVLKATSGGIQDTGYTFVPVANPTPQTVALRNHNGDNRDRSLCLTSGAGEAAAWQCGDLLVAHGLPGYATMGRERTLTLLYNSAQVAPKPVVTAAVTQGAVAPGAVFARLSINGVAKDSASWAGWASGTRQIALPHDALPDSSGVYPFTLMVRDVLVDSVFEVSVSDTLIVVNRAGSLYGAGWALAGVEELRLNQPGNKVLWVGGDGSAKVYRNVGTDTFVGAAGAFRDTLVRFDSLGYSYWRRRLRHGVSVTYSDTGSAGRAKHVRTTNRVGQSTVFAWSKDTLKSITVPPGISGTTYTLSYVSGRLDKITDPAGRILDVTVASNRLTQIIDPDNAGYHTDFAYDAAGRMNGRTNRRGFTTRYGYANGLRVTIDSVRLDSATATYGITTFTPWDERGLAIAPSGNTAVDTALAYTKIDGPRPSAVGDTAEFWVDRWGAPVRARDPLGSDAVVKRGDAANPALVTRAQFPDGRVLGAGYNGRGNLTFMADSTHDGGGTVQVATTSYLYGNAALPDVPTAIRTPVDTTRVTYDASLGLPDTMIAQGGHRTRFEYYTSGGQRGQLNRVVEVGVPVVDTATWLKSSQTLTTTLVYDVWGNDSIITSPGNRQTSLARDAFRRVSSVTDPGGHRTDYAYDVLNRTRTVTVTDGVALLTQYFPSATSAVDSVLDPRRVKQSWQYDAADQPVRMKDEAQVEEQRFFDRAGLLDSVRTRTQKVIRHRYDALGRLTTTVYPMSVYLTAPPDTIPGDSLAQTYDVAGRVLTARISGSTVTRTYNHEGTVRTEQQVLRDNTGAVISDVTMRYWYDLGDRRVKFFNGTDTLRYTYGTDGRLAILAVQWITGQPADTFRFYWDGLGRRDSLAYVRNGTFVTLGYDADGTLRMVCSRHSGNTGVGDYLEHRLRYVTLNTDGMVTNLQRYAGGASGTSCGGIPFGSTIVEEGPLEYDARHLLVRGGTDRFNYDSSGNRIAKRSIAGVLVDSFTYEPSRNRLFHEFNQNHQQVKSYLYQGDGAMAVETDTAVGANRLYYYNAIGQMTGHRAKNGGIWVGAARICVYDAFGRRTQACGGSPAGGLGFDAENVVRGGFDWRYVHGPGLDDPLVAMYHVGASEYRKYYYLTDGRGRHLAFTDSLGNDRMGDVIYFQTGGNQAGSIEKSHGFDNARGASSQTPQLSYYRNRYYDQQTGRFISEDPIGIAGGVNLYAYSANNPVAYTDPFGLCPTDGGGDGKTDEYSDCPPGTSGYRAYLAAQGRGGLANDIVGAYNACKEDSACKTTALIGGVITAVILVRAGYRAVMARPVLAGATVAIAPAAVKAFGQVVRWGQGAAQALQRLNDITAAEAAEFDPRVVEQVRQFYLNAASKGLGGEAAIIRAQLMQRILDLQR